MTFVPHCTLSLSLSYLPARKNLDHAFQIGDFRRTGLEDGNLARILWKQAEITTEEPLDPSYVYRQKWDKRNSAQLMRTTVEQKLGIRENDESVGEEESYDRLVCGFYR